MTQPPPLSTVEPPEEDLGAPGPGDDDAHRHSYLYEHVIDALVIFAARYVRTALLLARRPSRAADALLHDLDMARGRYTRPLAFLAISYMLFVAVVGYMPVLGQLIGEGAVHVDTEQLAARSFDLPLGELFSSFGNAEADYLVVAILAPLPAVVLVSLASNLLSNLLGSATEYSRSRFAMMVQYSVGLSLFSQVWLMAQTLGIIWALVRVIDAYEHSAGSNTLLVAIVATGLFLVAMSLATAALILAMSILPVWRVLKVLPDLRVLGLLRRALLSLAGPVVLLVTLGGISKLVDMAHALADPTVAMHVVRRTQDGDRIVLQGSVQGDPQGPLAITDWRVVWRGGDDHETGCADLDRRGTGFTDLPVNASAPVAQAVLPSLVEEGTARLVDGVLYLDAGESAWLRFEAVRPGPDPALSGRGPAWNLCARTSRDRTRWFFLAD